MNAELDTLKRTMKSQFDLIQEAFRVGDIERAHYYQTHYEMMQRRKLALEWRTTPLTQPTWKQEYGAKVFDDSWRSGPNTLIEEPPKVSGVLLGVLTELI